MKVQSPSSIPTSIATHLQKKKKKVFKVALGNAIIFVKNLMMFTGLCAFPRLVAGRFAPVSMALC